jgi:hypothetical protein
MPDGLTGVGWGIGVGAQESWAHQDEDGRRRPRACGKRGTQVPSDTRKLSTGKALWSWRKGNRRFMEVHGDGPQVLRRVR